MWKPRAGDGEKSRERHRHRSPREGAAVRVCARRAQTGPSRGADPAGRRGLRPKCIAEIRAPDPSPGGSQVLPTLSIQRRLEPDRPRRDDRGGAGSRRRRVLALPQTRRPARSRRDSDEKPSARRRVARAQLQVRFSRQFCEPSVMKNHSSNSVRQMNILLPLFIQVPGVLPTTIISKQWLNFVDHSA